MPVLSPHRVRRFGAIAMACFVAATAAACGDSSTQAAGGDCTADARPLVIATGNPGGVYAALGDSLADVLSAGSTLQVRAITTGSTLRNVQQLSTGEYDIAFAQADSAADAVLGQGVFAEPQKVQALARIYSDYTHVIATKQSGITSMADFRGKRIATGSPNSGTGLIAGRLLTAAGLDPTRDVQAQQLDLNATVDAIKSGAIDGFVWSGGLPTDAITKLFAADRDNLTFVDISGLLPAMQKLDKAYQAGSIPAAAYGTAADVPTIDLPNLLLVRDDFKAANACAIVKLLFDKKSELEKAAPAAAALDPKTALETAPIELNSGARAALTSLTG